MLLIIHFTTNSLQASNHNDSGDYEGAKKFGNAALCCNCGVFIYYVLLVLAGVAMVIVYFTVGFSWLVGHTADVTCYTEYYTDYDSYEYHQQCSVG